MNIWLCNPFDNLEEEGARPQRYALLSAELARRGHEVVWWTSSFSHARKAPRVATDGAPLAHSYRNANGVLMRLIDAPPYSRNVSLRRVFSHRAFARKWRFAALGAVGTKELQRPDLIVTSLPPLATHETARTLRDAFGCRLAVDVQDAWPEAFEGLLPFPAQLRRIISRLLFGRARETARRAYLTADCITAVGREYLETAREYGASGPMEVFRLGIADIAEDAATVTDGPLRLVYGGNMGASYDLSTLLAAVRALEGEQPGSVRLDVAGTGPTEAKLRKLAAGCGAIVFHGFLQRREYEELLHQSEVGVVPMFARSHVAVPNKLADYAASGLAILNCLTGESEELVARSHAGANYRAGDVDGLADAIRAMAKDGKALLAMRRNAIALAGKEFLAAKIYPALCDFILGAHPL
jgi:glycosyltransferase involved in cell wall biosynthesis